MFNKEDQVVFKFPNSLQKPKDRLTMIVETYFKNNKSVILFCNTKYNCEVYAKQLAEKLPEYYDVPKDIQMEDIATELTHALYECGASRSPRKYQKRNGRKDILKKLSMTSVGL